MISVYRVFQILLGIILSGFIFFILISYSGMTVSLSKEAEMLKTLDVFLQDCQTAYFSGLPVTYSEFKRNDFSLCFPESLGAPRITCDVDGKLFNTKQILIPMLARFDEEVMISRASLDYGWTRQDYLLVHPGITLVFNPRQNDDKTWDLVRELSMQFPDTTGKDPKARFEFCDGTGLLITNALGSPVEKNDFISIISSYRDSLSPCSANLKTGQTLVTISSTCSGEPTEGVCINPFTSDHGLAYLSGTGQNFVYKDSADILALVLGGSEKNFLEIPLGEENYKTKNRMMLDQLGTAAKLNSLRIQAIYSRLTTDQVSQDCIDKYDELNGILSQIETLSREEPSDQFQMSSLKAKLLESKNTWDDLIYMGCESRD